MLQHFFSPVPPEIWAPTKNNLQLIGGKILVNNYNEKIIHNSVAIVGIGEIANYVRKQLYNLTWRFENKTLVDLGNFIPSEDNKVSPFAISEALEILYKNNCIVLVLSPNIHDVYGVYKSYRHFAKQLEWVKVSPDIDLEEGSVLRQMLTEKPNLIYNIDFLATQAFYISQNTADILNNMYFENHRLGEIQHNIDETEPLLRSAQTLIFNVGSVRNSDAPNTIFHSPNGLYAEQAASIARYAGISNILNCAYFYGITDDDENNQTYLLIAQMIWYFIDGYCGRFNDHPIANHSDFLIYNTKLNSTGHEITFYKSKKSNRWWMKIPFPYDGGSYFMGCSYTDYETVMNDELPDRWWRAYQRMM